jgi:hypothetical protein
MIQEGWAVADKGSIPFLQVNNRVCDVNLDTKVVVIMMIEHKIHLVVMFTADSKRPL